MFVCTVAVNQSHCLWISFGNVNIFCVKKKKQQLQFFAQNRMLNVGKIISRFISLAFL